MALVILATHDLDIWDNRLINLRTRTDIPAKFLKPNRVLRILTKNAVKTIWKFAVDDGEKIWFKSLAVEALEVADGLLVAEDGNHAARPYDVVEAQSKVVRLYDHALALHRLWGSKQVGDVLQFAEIVVKVLRNVLRKPAACSSRGRVNLHKALGMVHLFKLPSNSILNDLFDKGIDLLAVVDHLGIQAVAHWHQAERMEHVFEVEGVSAPSSYGVDSLLIEIAKHGLGYKITWIGERVLWVEWSGHVDAELAGVNGNDVWIHEPLICKTMAGGVHNNSQNIL